MNLKLIELDGVGNLLLGLPLLLFPKLVSALLGLPASQTTLYPAILGAVFVGIGVALLLERFRPSVGGLGLGGAISINLIFGIVLSLWLLSSAQELPLRGFVLLSMLAVILVGISTVEVVSLLRSKERLTSASS